ncbi:ORF3 protein [Armillaria mellea negative-stranded RNA virus 1]|uniref:ORF3 protein n=1 Tax=Armillaria mellea negative-stranded RNA virus 1 TaxID=2827439 RepID=A0AAX1ME48_9MONO|nr:ORF3 protein [Armillaria mellea negative-stranded RNA virus 1]QUD20351.1 ORF3 protein [Armillaria mellea negative-stranded RNA virus 1]
MSLLLIKKDRLPANYKAKVGALTKSVAEAEDRMMELATEIKQGRDVQDDILSLAVVTNQMAVLINQNHRLDLDLDPLDESPSTLPEYQNTIRSAFYNVINVTRVMEAGYSATTQAADRYNQLASALVAQSTRRPQGPVSRRSVVEHVKKLDGYLAVDERDEEDYDSGDEESAGGSGAGTVGVYHGRGAGSQMGMAADDK